MHPDLFALDDLLTGEERAVRDRVRAFSDAEVVPIMADCWERGEFPLHLVPGLADLGICGDTVEGYGCAGLSVVGAGLAAMELARGDGSIYTFFGATSGFAINTIHKLGSERQKEGGCPASLGSRSSGPSPSPSLSTARTWSGSRPRPVRRDTSTS